MNGLPYYKAYPRDFIEGTIGMSFELKCAYRVVLDLIYMQSGKLPDDARYISGLLGCSIRKWNSIRSELISRGKIQASNGFISNYRADKELETLRKLSAKQSENRSRPNKNKKLKSPPIIHTEPDTETPISPSKGKRAPGYSDRFEAWWKSYPRKLNASKAKASKAFERLSEADRQLAEQSLPAFRKAMAGTEERFIPHPTTWLNERRFETVGAGKVEEGPDRWRVRLEAWAMRGTWSEKWGPDPNSPACKAPADLIRQAREQAA